MNPNGIPFFVFVTWWAGVAAILFCAVVWTADHWAPISKACDRVGDWLIGGGR